MYLNRFYDLSHKGKDRIQRRNCFDLKHQFKRVENIKRKKQKHSKKSPVLSTDEHETDELIGELWLCILDTMGGVSGIELRISALILGASLLNIESAKLDLLCE